MVREQYSSALVLQSLPATLYLAAFAAALALLIAVPLGIVSAACQATPIDAAIRVAATFARSLPYLAIPLGLLLLLVANMEWLALVPQDGSLLHLLLAGLILSLFHIAPVLVWVRALAFDALQSLTTPATRPGITAVGQALVKYLRRNPALVLSTYFGTFAGVLLVGSVIGELVLGWPGAARLAIDMPASLDYQLAAVVVLTFAALFITGRFLLDALNAYLSRRSSGQPQESCKPSSPALDTEALSGLSIPTYPTEIYPATPTPSTSPFRILGAVLAVTLLLVVLVLALAPSLIAPGDPMAKSPSDRLLPPFAWPQGPEGTSDNQNSFSLFPAWKHALGTDELGRDILSRIIHGLQIAIASAALTVGVAAIAGVSLGFVAGYRGGWLETAISTLADVTRSIPAAALLRFTVLAQSPPAILLIAGAVVLWATYFHHVRRQTRATRQQPLAEGKSVEVLGFSETLRRLAPTTARTIAVLAALQAGFVVLLHFGISYLGYFAGTLGVYDLSTPFLGLMVYFDRQYIDVAWWMTLFPALAIVLLAFCFNLLGDWLRDLWAPTLSHPFVASPSNPSGTHPSGSV